MLGQVGDDKIVVYRVSPSVKSVCLSYMVIAKVMGAKEKNMNKNSLCEPGMMAATDTGAIL